MHTKGIHQGIGLCLEWGLTAVELGLSNFFRWWQQSWSWRGKYSFFKNTVLYSILSSDKIQVCFMTGCNKFTDCHSFAMSCSQNQTCFCAQPLRFPFSDKQCKSVNIKLSLKKENKQKLIFLPIKASMSDYKASLINQTFTSIIPILVINPFRTQSASQPTGQHWEAVKWCMIGQFK